MTVPQILMDYIDVWGLKDAIKAKGYCRRDWQRSGASRKSNRSASLRLASWLRETILSKRNKYHIYHVSDLNYETCNRYDRACTEFMR